MIDLYQWPCPVSSNLSRRVSYTLPFTLPALELISRVSLSTLGARWLDRGVCRLTNQRQQAYQPRQTQNGGGSVRNRSSQGTGVSGLPEATAASARRSHGLGLGTQRQHSSQEIERKSEGAKQHSKLCAPLKAEGAKRKAFVGEAFGRLNRARVWAATSHHRPRACQLQRSRGQVFSRLR